MSADGQSVFISYAWGDEREEIVNELDQALQSRGVKIIRDKRDLGYKGSVREFMQKIGQGNCVIVVISDKYLRSPNCMFELVEIARNKDVYDRIFPIVLADADIYNPVNRIKYIKHWEDQLKELDAAMKLVNSANLQGIREDIDLYDRIRAEISGLTSTLKDMNTLTPEMHRESNFSHLFDAIEKKLKESSVEAKPASRQDGKDPGTASEGIVASEVRGNVIHINISPDAIRQVNTIAQMPTSVPQNQAAGMEGNATVRNLAPLEETLNQLLEVLKVSGRSVNEIQAGDLHLSRVELLLKKAILVKTEADQMYFDHMARYKQKRGGSGAFEIDFNEAFSDFDAEAHLSRLKEAYALLQEANGVDPANTEVLLHMAQLLIELTPDDPSDELRLLHRVQNLLRAPKDDAEKFRLAQATFLVATSGETIHADSLGDARAMFEQLGRSEWVRQCDDLLSQAGGSPGAWQPQAGFQPVGDWQVQAHDAVNSTMSLRLHPNGAFEAVQQLGPFGAALQAVGQWAYIPDQQLLQLQGMVNGFQPFMLGIMIQGQQGEIYQGTGHDGFLYTLARV